MLLSRTIVPYVRKKFNWELIQKDYDSGLSQRELIAKYGMAISALYKAKSRGDIVFRSCTESIKLYHETHMAKPLSTETKQKISIARRKFLEANPDKVPYKLNHYSKGPSYPERYFKELFENENMNLVSEYQISYYQLDFADVEKKIDVEIDGEQHYADERIVASDARRNSFLKDQGWVVFRIRWRDYQKLKLSEKQKIITTLKEVISEPDKFR